MIGETYFNTFLCLWETIKKKHPGKLSQGMILSDDNARLPKAQLIGFLLNDFSWDVFENSARSLDLASSNYNLFANLHC